MTLTANARQLLRALCPTPGGRYPAAELPDHGPARLRAVDGATRPLTRAEVVALLDLKAVGYVHAPPVMTITLEGEAAAQEAQP